MSIAYATDTDGNEIYPVENGNQIYLQEKMYEEYNEPPEGFRQIPARNKDGVPFYAKINGKEVYPIINQFNNDRYFFIQHDGKEIYAKDKMQNYYYPDLVDPYAKDRDENQYYVEIEGKQIYAKLQNVEIYARTKNNTCIYALDKGVPYYAKDEFYNEIYAYDTFYQEFYIEIDDKEIYAKSNDSITELYAKDVEKSQFYALDEGKKYYAKKQWNDEYYAQTADRRDIYFTDMKYASGDPPVNPLINPPVPKYVPANRLKPITFLGPIMGPPPYNSIVWPPPPPPPYIPKINPPPYIPKINLPSHKPSKIPPMINVPPHMSVINPPMIFPLPQKKNNIFYYLCLFFLFFIMLLVLFYIK